MRWERWRGVLLEITHTAAFLVGVATTILVMKHTLSWDCISEAFAKVLGG